MKKAIVVDIDGCIANLDHRVHYVQRNPKRYVAFNKAMPNDTVNEWCKELLFNYVTTHTVILCTCREGRHRKVTEQWLEDNNIPYDMLLMRPSKSGHGKDNKHKKKMYEECIEGKYDVEWIIEDRLSVVKMWRKLGLVVLQPDWGDF